jgi:hypothetical protein
VSLESWRKSCGWKDPAPKPPEVKIEPAPEVDEDIGAAPVDHELDEANAILDEAERRDPAAFERGRAMGEILKDFWEGKR